MPIYEYRCERGHTFEVMQRMTDDPLVCCQTCDAPVERVFRPVAVHFKGSGFYTTDYGPRRRARDAEEAKESSDAKDSKSAAKDSKSESKAQSGSSTAAAASSASSG